ncbi:hypothetical protein [Mammaliicoccus sp. H-M34]|uniref:hypothetical protein n=1 Tax=Mammaliicoccus sp. H-M34 TaxID=2898693 RepID=UPI001EFA5A80|nr:hypothetical protein [Mammaliicoccus sp. H-M34]
MIIPKTKDGTRDVYAPTHIIETLRDYKKRHKSEHVFKPFYIIFGNYFNNVAD